MFKVILCYPMNEPAAGLYYPESLEPAAAVSSSSRPGLHFSFFLSFCLVRFGDFLLSFFTFVYLFVCLFVCLGRGRGTCHSMAVEIREPLTRMSSPLLPRGS